jgi:hypothetical protein
MSWTYKPSCRRTSTLKTDSSPVSAPFNFHPHRPSATVIQVHGTETEDDVAISRWQTDYWGVSFFSVPSGKYLDSKSNRPRPPPSKSFPIYHSSTFLSDRLCGLVFRVPGYRSRGPGSITGTTRFSVKLWVGNGVHSAS